MVYFNLKSESNGFSIFDTKVSLEHHFSKHFIKVNKMNFYPDDDEDSKEFYVEKLLDKIIERVNSIVKENLSKSSIPPLIEIDFDEIEGEIRNQNDPEIW